MTTNVIVNSTGVAYLSILIILSTFFVEQGLSRPSNIYPLNMEPHSATKRPYDPARGPTTIHTLPKFSLPWDKAPSDPHIDAQGQKLFLVTKNQSWLEILPNKTIRGNTCKTKYGLLESFSHEGAQVLKGVETGFYLCMTPKGHLYAGSWSETNCAFLTKLRREKKTGAEFPTYGHHKHHKLIQTKKDGNKTRRFYFGINCNGLPIVVSSETQRKLNKDYIRFIESREGLEDKTPNDFKESCEKSKCPSENPHSSGGVNPNPPKPKGRNYLKFCRAIRKRFFQATLKELRRFTKRDCWKRLARSRSSKRKNKSKKRHRRRHRRLSPMFNRKSTDPT